MMEFQKLLVKVADVFMGRLVFLFTEGFYEPLKGLVKYHKPTTLKDVMILTRDAKMCFLEQDFLPSLTSNLKIILGKAIHLIIKI